MPSDARAIVERLVDEIGDAWDLMFVDFSHSSPMYRFGCKFCHGYGATRESVRHPRDCAVKDMQRALHAAAAWPAETKGEERGKS